MKKGLILILTLGVFSIINTEMGVVGILPLISENYGVTVATAGMLVSMFALVVAASGPTMPLFFSGINRKKAMVLVLSVFTACNVISAFASNFPVVLITRVIPAFFQPVYVSMAMSVAGSSVPEKESPKAVARVMMGVSAGMVLGVPIVSYISSLTSLRAGMLFFAAVNAAALIATIIAVPDLPVKERMSYGSQLSVLKEGKTWLSIFGVMFLNGSVFGVYSYLSEYMETVTQLSAGLISILLLVYGLSNMIGNLIAGRLLSSRPKGFVVTFPFFLAAVYAVLFFLGYFTVPMGVLTFVWGVLAGAAANINQYWLATAAPKAPDFANGLFLASTNLGTTVGTTACGFFLSRFGTRYIVLGGILFIVCAFALITWRVYGEERVKSTGKSLKTA
ncbi:MAG TPA: MFS transporter [Candidatus Mediterraneibacter stercoravium]|uniref:MFS transporter n=1 Tax=Candidatus Mediterraneibacter stercoravium TaxID=2838685 RepID=A0A9D2GA46_9FIRM|nr:MFS transporter [Candidatus Mediterraneibacter stercoravium]